ncbi:MAG: methionyl-tRNA formyltransferase [Thermoanaerobaculia bacterium]
MKAVFFGTPEFAVPSLEALLACASVPLVVTQPDRPIGRHARPVPSPVARRAQAAGLPIVQPLRLRGNRELAARLEEVAPDVGAVVAYGKILPPEILAVPRLGFVNVHASLLPRHRGASPVQAALAAGDAETGVVTMRVVEQLDAGPLYLARRVPIGPEEDAGALSRRLSRIGAELLVETLAGLEGGTLQAVPQSGEATFCRPLSREDGEVDWTFTAEQIARRLRAFSPWPGLHTFLGRERVKILAARPAAASAPRAPGTVWIEGGEALAAAGGATAVVLDTVQRSGRKPVSGAEFLRGLPRLPGFLGRRAAG